MSETIIEKVEGIKNQLKPIVRDEYGLIKGCDYIFDDNGKVNWRKMIKPEYLVPMRGIKETDVTKLSDKELMILLQGIKELAELRGYKSVTYKVINSSPEYCCAVCTIKWTGNYETEGREIEFESIGDASLASTDSFAKLYMGAIAENRAFVRCVRNFLRINIVGKDEISNDEKGNVNNSNANEKQIKLLEELMDKKKVLFEPHIISKLKEMNEWNDKYKSIRDLPPNLIFHFLERIKKYNPN